MYKWNVILINKERTITINVKARSYADAYIKAEQKYPDGRVISIKKAK